MSGSGQSLFDRVAAEMTAHLDDDSSGHDMHHARRVNRLGVRIAEAENANPRVVGVAGLVHDLHRVRGDGFTHPEETIPGDSGRRACPGSPPGPGLSLRRRPRGVRLRGRPGGCRDRRSRGPAGRGQPRCDRCRRRRPGVPVRRRARQPPLGPDRPLPDDNPYEKDAGIDDGPASTYHHVHSKLLRLHENMKTEAGREIAVERHAFLEEFAERFEQEWYGEA